MDIVWNHPMCIVCLNQGKLTKEHVIPDSLGGKLTSRFLCKECNSRFGSGFEAKARLAPELRRAACGLGKSIPELKEKLERGAEYDRNFGEYNSKSKVGRDVNFSTSKLGDGSLIISELEFPNHIISIMTKKGMPKTDIDKALATWENAPAARVVDLGAGVSVYKWQDHPATPTYTEPTLNPLVPLKIAYEFAALLVGSMIYRPEFQYIRDVLSTQEEDLPDGMVTYNWAAKSDAFHGITFEGNQDVAQFQVRLFGLLAYTVRFPMIAIEHKRVVYTHRLDINKEWVHMAKDGR